MLVSGLLMGLFIPGFLATRLIFREEDIGTIDAFTYSIALSLAFDIILGLFLGANSGQKEITGGITAANIWVGLLAVSFILCLALAVKRRVKYK